MSKTARKILIVVFGISTIAFIQLMEVWLRNEREYLIAFYGFMVSLGLLYIYYKYKIKNSED